MFITNPEYDFWPWSWKNQNKSCSSLNDYKKAWKTIDWLNDKTFDPRSNKLRNNTGEHKNRIVAKGIICQTHDVDISEKITLSLSLPCSNVKFSGSFISSITAFSSK